jgi:cation:H+ antiporter
MLWMFLGGLIGLVAGAELLVRGASKLALSWGISPLVVGLTIVAFGTSAPEVAVSVGAALDGRTDIAIGNVVGSNVFNVLFILGLSALIIPLTVNAQIIRQEVPIMIGASLLLLVLGLDGVLSPLNSALLLALMLVYTLYLIVQSRRETSATVLEEFDHIKRPGKQWDSHWLAQVLLIGVGLALLVMGSQWLVSASVEFAKALGVSDLVIGLTIVAAGTSMPEVATSIMAALRKERDIAIGNVVGSNTFNILGSLGISGMVASGGLAMSPAVLNFDIWVMVAVMFACLPVFISGREIARWEGFVFIGYYVAYAAYLILAAQEHDALQPYSTAMVSFVIPLTIVTLIAVMLKPSPKRVHG